jgi:uncharacterized protein
LTCRYLASDDYPDRIDRSIPSGVADAGVAGIGGGDGNHDAQSRRDAVGFPPVDLSADEIRVLGCLIEKQKTTPDQYPLSLNALRLAASQSTNRDPVLVYDEPTVRAAVQKLSSRGWARLATGATSRAIKYRQLFDEEFDLRGPQLAVMAVLMLRGPQTLGELKQRTERMHRFESVGAVVETLEDLIERELAERLERRPGQKEERYRHLLGGEAADAAPSPSAVAAAGEDDRVTALEERVTRLEEQLAELRRARE